MIGRQNFLPVDDTEQVLLALLHNPTCAFTSASIRRLVLSIEHVVGGWGQGSSDSGNVIGHLEDSLAESLVNHDGAHIIIVVCCGRSVDDDGASDTTSILSQGVRVIPTSSISRGVPNVGSGRSWCDSTLSNTGNTILVVRANLSDTMPMDSGGIVSESVDNSDLDHIAPVGNDWLTRSLAIDGERSLGGAIKADQLICNGQEIALGLASLESIVSIVINGFSSAPAATVFSIVARWDLNADR